MCRATSKAKKNGRSSATSRDTRMSFMNLVGVFRSVMDVWNDENSCRVLHLRLLPKLQRAILRHDSRDKKRVGNSQAGAILPCFCSPYPTCRTLAGTVSLSMPYPDGKPKLLGSSVPMCRCEKHLQSRVRLRFAGGSSPLYNQLHQEMMSLLPMPCRLPAP